MRRYWRLRASLVIVPLVLLGTLVLSASAYAAPLTLNGNEAPALQKLTMYPPDMLLMNLPTEYDVTSGLTGSAVETSIPDQVVSSVTTWQTYYTTSNVLVTSPTASGTTAPQLPTFNPCPLGDCVHQAKPYRQNGSSGSSASGPIVYPAPSGACSSYGSSVCARGGAWDFHKPTQSTTPLSVAQGGAQRYVPVQVQHERAIVTTITNSGIHITNAKLLRVAPMLFGINSTGSNLDGVNIQGAQCTTPTTPLISPLSPQLPNYSLQPWLYSTYFTNLGICTINPAWVDGGYAFATWLNRADSVQFDLRPVWQLTAGYNTVTTANGAVTNSVPGTSTQVVIAHLYHGPTLPVKAITAVPCVITKGVATCPNGQSMPVPN